MIPSDRREALIRQLEASIQKLSPLDQRSGARLKADALSEVEFAEGKRSLHFRFRKQGCVAIAQLSEEVPATLQARAICWEFRGAQSCVHLAGALMALRDQVDTNAWQGPVAAWLKLLEPPSPEAVLNRLGQIVATHSPAGSDAEGWLMWRLTAKDDGIAVTPLVRTALKNGQPGKGRIVSQHNSDGLRPYARTEQDAAVLALADAVRDGSMYGYYSPSLQSLPPLKVLAALAGHPDVEWANAGQIHIQTQAPGLAVVEVDGSYQLRPALGGHAIVSPSFQQVAEDGVVAYWAAAKRVVVGLWSVRAGRLARDLLKTPVHVPLGLGAALVQRLSSVHRTLPLALPPELQGRSVPPDNEPILVCEPQHPMGAIVRIRMRPLPGGPQQTPGVGERELTGFVGNDRLSTRRELEMEIERASRLAARLPLAPAKEDPWNRQLGTDHEVLELVSALRAPEFADLRVEWPEGARPQLVGPPLRSMRVHIEAREDWFGIEGQAEVDGVSIQLAKVMTHAKAGQRFVAIGQGRFIELERAFKDRVARLGDVTHEHRDGLRLSPVAASLAGEAFEGWDVVAPFSWKQMLERIDRARTTTPQVPAELKAELRDYQLDGYRWLWRLAEMGVGGVLADDMGLGKTVQAIAMLLQRAGQGPQLIVAPTSVCLNWQRELTRFAPSLNVVDFRTTDRETEFPKLGPNDVVIASYALLRLGLEPLQQVTWTSLVFDEAQAFKNYETQTAKAARSLKADWKLALTGTPLENHLGELYSLMQTVCPGLLGPWDHFAGGFARPIEKEKSVARREALARVLRPFMLRRTKQQVLKELPPRTELRLDATLSKQERALYEAVRLSTLQSLEEADETVDPRFLILAALTRMRQIASHARMIDPAAPKISAKQAVLMDQLEAILEEGHSALIFSQFTSQLQLLEEEMHSRDITTLYLDGTTPPKERQKRVEAFQRGEAPVFLVSLKAGGTGLNLTAADYVFLMDPWWNPAVEDQAADRAHRIGQQRPVTIVRLVATGTVEEKVLSLHAKKRQLVAGVLDGAEMSGKLSTEELVGLLRESQDSLWDNAAAITGRSKYTLDEKEE